MRNMWVPECIGRTGSNNNGQHTCKTKRMKRNIKSIFLFVPVAMLFAFCIFFFCDCTIDLTTTTKPNEKFAFDELSKQVTFANRISDNKLRSILKTICLGFLFVQFFFVISMKNDWNYFAQKSISAIENFKQSPSRLTSACELKNLSNCIWLHCNRFSL